jgi:hypothetical protein
MTVPGQLQKCLGGGASHRVIAVVGSLGQCRSGLFFANLAEGGGGNDS